MEPRRDQEIRRLREALENIARFVDVKKATLKDRLLAIREVARIALTADKLDAPAPQFFRTIADMHAIPPDKLHAFCTDLRLWLAVHREAEQDGRKITTPTDVFGWIDDGAHDVVIIHDRTKDGEP